MLQLSKYCLVGIPDHLGVMNVGGRVGAALGPEALRRALGRMKGRVPVIESLHDAGDVRGIGADLGLNHRLAADLVREAHRGSGVSVVVGGGHDHGFSHLLGISEACGKKSRGIGCINVDAHLDVRKPDPLITSGSPFYLAIESGVLDPGRLVEFGIQAHCNGAGLWEYAAAKRIAVVPFERLRGGKAIAGFKQTLKNLSARCGAIVLSVDLDAAAQAFAPGVSAPQSEGFTASELVQMAELAGSSPQVVSLGLFELNPLHDVDDLTARLAATVAWHFLAARMGRAS